MIPSVEEQREETARISKAYKRPREIKLEKRLERVLKLARSLQNFSNSQAECLDRGIL